MGFWKRFLPVALRSSGSGQGEFELVGGRDTPLARLTRNLAALEGAARRPLGVAILAIVIVVHAVAVVPRRMGDFILYRQAAERVIEGETPYRLSDPHRYLYAPVISFGFAPFAPLPDYGGRLAWYLLNLLVAVDLFRRSMRMVMGGERAPPGLALAAGLVVFRFVDNNLGHGQINLVVAWLMVFAYERAALRSFAVAGFALAVATLTKIFPVVLLLHLLVRREWRFLLATAASGILLMALPFLWWGTQYPAVLETWLQVLMAQGGHYDFTNKASQSITSFAVRAFGAGTTASVAAIVSVNLALATVLVAVTLRGRRASDQPAGVEGGELAVGLSWSTVLMPIAWKYYFANLVLPATILARRLWDPKATWAHVAFGVAVLLNLLPGLRLFGKAAGIQFQMWSFHFWSVILLVAFAASLLLRSPRSTDSPQ